MRSNARTWSAGVVAVMLIAGATLSAENNQKAFEKTWVGRHVVVKQPLYSLVYNEHVRGGTKSARDGLTVVSPFNGRYFQFTGRRDVATVTEADVQKIASAVRLAYQKEMMLEDGINQVIDPLMLSRYDPGTELVVKTARVYLTTVRLELAGLTESDRNFATTLTVQWPTPLSKSFSERVDVEGLIQQFVTIRQ